MSTSAARPAVFLDRDGTLNEEVHYLHRIEDLVWLEGVEAAIRQLNEAGVWVLVVTNQAGIARGYFTEGDLHALHEHMQRHLRAHGAHIDAFYFSPYHPEGTIPRYRRVSPCRKPGTGLLEQACTDWPIDRTRSALIGDKNSDIDAGRAFGLTTYLVETGYGAEEKAATHAHHLAADLSAATAHFLAHLAEA